jgi:aspartate aminotransferase
LVVAGPGSKALLYAVLATERGAVAPRPSWVSYAVQAALLGREVVSVPTLPGQGGVPDPERLDAEARRRRIGTVVVTLPDNPTGTLALPETVAALCQVARRHELTIVSDEIYRDLVYNSSLTSPAELAPERTVVTTGLSKSLALGGWRLGVARLPNGRLRDGVVTIASEIWSAPAQPVQRVAAWALTEPTVLRDHVTAARTLHERVARAVAAALDVPAPAAAFYLYPDFSRFRSFATSDELAEHLLREHGIATLPGSVFGDSKHVMRLRLATSQLYGSDDEQRWAALRHPEPSTLPWIARHLDRLRELTG